MKLLRPESPPACGDLAEVLAHELRNPLASAVASICVAREMTDPGDPRAAFLDRATAELTRVSALLTTYLDFGRQGSTHRYEIDLAEVAAGVVLRYRGHRARIALETDGRGARLDGDPVLLERLVENLVENALSMGAGHVDLLLARDGGACVLHVTDDGPGVPAAMRDCLFEPEVSGRGSSGLGLALCRDVVESHGGSITLVPSATGAMFRVTLPARWR